MALDGREIIENIFHCVKPSKINRPNFIKNMYEVEGTIDTRTSSFKFLDRTSWLFLDNCPEETMTLRPTDQKELVLRTDHYERLDGQAVIKFFWKNGIHTRKVKMLKNRCVVQVINNTDSDVVLKKNEPLGIVDLRSIGYYEVSAIMLKQHLSSEYKFLSPRDYADSYNKLVNSWTELYNLQQTTKIEKDPYPWLDPKDPT